MAATAAYPTASGHQFNAQAAGFMPSEHQYSSYEAYQTWNGYETYTDMQSHEYSEANVKQEEQWAPQFQQQSSNCIDLDMFSDMSGSDNSDNEGADSDKETESDLSGLQAELREARAHAAQLAGKLDAKDSSFKEAPTALPEKPVPQAVSKLGASAASFSPAINLDQYSDDSDDSDFEDHFHARFPSKEMALQYNATPWVTLQVVEPAAEPSPHPLTIQTAAKTFSEDVAPCGEFCRKEDALAKCTETDAGSTPDDSGSSEPDAEESCASEVELEEPSCAGSNHGNMAVGPVCLRELMQWRSFVVSEGVRGEQHHCVAAFVPAASSTAPAPSRAARGPRAGGAQAKAPQAKAPSDGAGNAGPRQRNSGAKALNVSENSWAAKQRERRSTTDDSIDEDAAADAEVVRVVKSILNKLTIEKFPKLSKKLVECGFHKQAHVECLIQELFEKATTQHHFIDMYADLCTLLQEHFVDSPIGGDAKFSFKRLLLNECQRSFELNLRPPTGLDDLTSEQREVAQFMYKTRMLGNIRFVGALLARRMLASKVLIAIMEELLTDPTPEALESLAALLTAVGPVFDTPEWTYHLALKSYFEQVKNLVDRDDCPLRIRCLLMDVLDLRMGSWKDQRPKKMEGPSKLSEVKDKAAAETGTVGAKTLRGQKAPGRTGASSAVKSPVMKATTPTTKEASLKKKKQSPPATPTAGAVRAKLALMPRRSAFDKEAFRAEVQKALAELRASHDGAEVTKRLASAVAPPAAMQSGEFCRLLADFAQEGNAAVRKAGFEAVAALFVGSEASWNVDAVESGLRTFVQEVCEDLRLDVPALPQILQSELRPALARLVRSGALQQTTLSELL